MKKYSRILLILLFALFLSGCATNTKWSRYEICFGLSADAGRTVITEQQWQQFQDNEIAGRFPDGFTVFTATGHWREGDKTFSEPSRILMVVAPGSEETDYKINAIARTYAEKFSQQSVLEIKSPAAARFIKPRREFSPAEAR